jgi:HPt (histidine-containing phosphotransfer) domain-containing protein
MKTMARPSPEKPETLFGALRSFLRELSRDIAGLLRGKEKTRAVHDDQPDFDRLDREFATEMYVGLLLELPEQRARLTAAYESGDLDEFDRQLHRLHGSAVYCEVPELCDSLQRMRTALGTGEKEEISTSYARMLNVIECTLRSDRYERRLEDFT